MVTDEDSWAKKSVLLHRQRQLDEINDLLEVCCEDADASKEICPLCKLCNGNSMNYAIKMRTSSHRKIHKIW